MTADISTLLEGIQSESGRTEIVHSLVYRGIELPKPITDATIQYLVERNKPLDHSRAAFIAAETGDPMQAIQLRLGKEEYSKALETALKADLPEQVERIYATAVTALEEKAETNRRLYVDAAHLAQRLGKDADVQRFYRAALDNCIAQKHWSSASRYAEKLGLREEALEHRIRRIEEIAATMDNGEMNAYYQAEGLPNIQQRYAQATVEYFIGSKQFKDAGAIAKKNGLDELAERAYLLDVERTLKREPFEAEKKITSYGLQGPKVRSLVEANITHLIERSKHQAARLAKAAGLHTLSRQCYEAQMQAWEEQGHIHGAHQIAEEAGFTHKAKIYKGLIDILDTNEPATGMIL